MTINSIHPQVSPPRIVAHQGRKLTEPSRVRVHADQAGLAHTIHDPINTPSNSQSSIALKMPSSFQLFEDAQDPQRVTGWSYPSVHKPSQVFIQDEEIQVAMIEIGRAVLKFKKSHQTANPGRLEQMHGAQVRFYLGTDFFHEGLDEKQLSVAFSELREIGEKTRPWEKPTHDERLFNMLSGKGAAPKRKGPKSILKVKEGPKDFTLEEKLAAAAINLAAAKWAYTTAVFIFCKKEQELQELLSQELSSKNGHKLARLNGIATKYEAEPSDRFSASSDLNRDTIAKSKAAALARLAGVPVQPRAESPASTSSGAWASSTLVDMHIAEERAAAYAKLNGLPVQSEAESESYASSTLNMEAQVDEATASEPFSKRAFHEMLAANSYHYNDTGTAILKFVTHLRRRTRNDLFTAKEKQDLMALTKVIRFNIKFPEAAIAIRKWKRSIGTEDERTVGWEAFYPMINAMVEVELLDHDGFKLTILEDKLFECIRSRKQLKKDIKEFGPIDKHKSTIRINGGEPFVIESAAACHVKREMARVFRAEQKEARKAETEAEKAERKAEKKRQRTQQLMRMKAVDNGDGTVHYEPMGSDEEGDAINMIISRKQNILEVFWRSIKDQLKDIAPSYSNV